MMTVNVICSRRRAGCIERCTSGSGRGVRKPTAARWQGAAHPTSFLSFAEFERAIISERVRDKIAGAKRKGKFTGGTPVLGYDIDPETHGLVMNPEEAKVVRLIFRRYTEVASGLTIARNLNARGITTKSRYNKRGEFKPGIRWNSPSIYRVLNNRTYLGETKHMDQIFPGEHDSIITKALWDKVHGMIQPEKTGKGRTYGKVQALLAGIIRCGCCDHAMYSTYTKRHGKIYRYYLCVKAAKSGYDSCPVKSVPAGEIEDAVFGQLRAIFRSPEMVAQTYMAATQLAVDEADDDRPSNADALPVLTERDVADALSKLDPIWEELFPAEKRRIMQLLVERVTVREDDLDISFRSNGLHSLVSELRDTLDSHTERTCEV